MTIGVVFKTKKYALHDGPGIRTTVFLKGCPLRCAWCHNPEGQGFDPQPLRPARPGEPVQTVGRQVSADQVLAEIEKDRIFYDQSGGGATFSGGEPMARPDFLAALLTGCRQRGIHSAVDTSGYAPAADFARLCALADLVLFDLKIMDPAAHKRLCGVDNDMVLDNYRALARIETPVVVRFPVVPGMTDGPDNVCAMIDFLSIGPRPQAVHLLSYHCIAQPKYQRLEMACTMGDIAPPDDNLMAGIGDAFAAAGHTVSTGGA